MAGGMENQKNEGESQRRTHVTSQSLLSLSCALYVQLWENPQEEDLQPPMTSDLLLKKKKQLWSSATAATFNLIPPFSLPLSSKNLALHADVAASTEACLPACLSLLLSVCTSAAVWISAAAANRCWQAVWRRTVGSFQLLGTKPFDENQKPENVQVHWKSGWNHTIILYAVKNHVSISKMLHIRFY